MRNLNAAVALLQLIETLLLMIHFTLYRVFYLIFISAIVTVLQFSAYIFLPNA